VRYRRQVVPPGGLSPSLKVGPKDRSTPGCTDEVRSQEARTYVMTRTLVALAAMLALCASRPAYAQTYVQPRVSPYSTPGFSPYLNLLRGGNQAVNYYGLVLPEIKAMNSIQQLQEQVARPQQTVVAPPTNRAQSETGHVTRFMQYGQYFNTTSNHQQPGATPPAAAFGRR
jgi:hypothetical protein